MRLTKFLFKTLREAPKDAKLDSHILLLRAGYIKKLVSGIYYFTPLGLRVLKKIEEIIREEMNDAGAIELLMSAIQPKEPWIETGRWENFGEEMLKFKDRHNNEFALGPTHEEVFTNFVKEEINSYKELPFNIYQIQTKYRDEIRPRFGLLRSREFIMKDAYSFHASEESLDEEYKNMYKTYEKIFTRLGLDFTVVEADSGAIGGNVSHEFQALTKAGESELIYCKKCGYSSTRERAKVKEVSTDKNKNEEPKNREEILTENIKTIEDLSKFFNVPKTKTIKAVLLKINDKKVSFVAAFVRGDREANLTKIANCLNVNEEKLMFLEEEDIRKNNLEDKGIVAGFTGPQNIKDESIKIIVDTEIVSANNLIAGAGKKDYHETNINYERDFKSDITADIKLASEGDICPNCDEKLNSNRGIEVGQVFKLGDKYSKALNAKYKGEDEKEKNYIMGCYGIGVTRTMQAIVEQNFDENGICFPENVAPFKVIIVVVNIKDETQVSVSEEIYKNLLGKKIEVLLDDRDERAGVKFKDADLIGIPHRITVGKKAGEGIVEYNKRDVKEVREVNKDEVLTIIS